jgi:nitroreductase
MEDNKTTWMNSTTEHQLGHKTIREFEQKPVPKEIVTLLFDVARRTASSNGMQQYSIIHVTDQAIKDEIAKVAGQEYIKRTPELFIFIVDQFRNASIAKAKQVEVHHGKDMDRFFQGFTDACLAAQNMVNAAESFGLGTMYLGSILNDSERICELLHLPELTFPVVGLAVGYPGQAPQLKPRMASHLKVFENTYQPLEDYLEAVKDYDEEMQNYYDLRMGNQRMDSFSEQVAAKYQMFMEKRQGLLKVIEKQGFR